VAKIKSTVAAVGVYIVLILDNTTTKITLKISLAPAP
jgi:hypothetical protein